MEGDVPETTDELYDYMVAHTDVDAGTYALVNQHSTAYNVAPVINGFGGYIIDKDANPGLNTQETKELSHTIRNLQHWRQMEITTQ